LEITGKHSVARHCEKRDDEPPNAYSQAFEDLEMKKYLD
jgi:hypothetical protein